MSYYFPKLYEQDLIAYKALGNNCLCGRVIDDICKNHSDKILHLTQFYVHNFFITIFSETIDNYFPEYSDRWRQESYQYIDYKCTNNDSRLFWSRYTKGMKYKGDSMKVHPAEYIQAAQEVIKYTEKILEKDGFDNLNADMIRDKIMNDNDNPEAIRMMMDDQYLNLVNEEE